MRSATTVDGIQIGRDAIAIDKLIAHFERRLIAERTRDGLRATEARQAEAGRRNAQFRAGACGSRAIPHTRSQIIRHWAQHTI